jgi:hypothetical protein
MDPAADVSRSHLVAGLSVRPPRVGLLVPTRVQGASWIGLYEAALAAQATFWGGSGNIVLPLTRDFTTNELFWELADLFDADAFVVYAPTWDEWAEIAPRAHRRSMAKLRADVETKHGKNVADQLVEDASKETAIRVVPSEEQIQCLTRRVAPFHWDAPRHIHLNFFDAISGAVWPLTDVRKFVELPADFEVPRAPPGVARKLLLTAAIGRFGRGARSMLADRGAVLRDSDLRKTWKWAEVAVGRRRGREQDDPWALSEVGLSPYRRGGLVDQRAALVVGNTPWDFSLFYALKRMSGMAWWLPSWLERDPTYMFYLGSALQFEPQAEGRDLVIVSASSVKARDRVARTIAGAAGHPVNFRTAHWREALPDQPIRFYELHNVGRYQPIEIIDGATLPLDTPFPKRVSTAVPTQTGWITEIQARNWTPARDARLPKALLSEIRHGTDTMRVTRDGVAYFCPDVMTFGADSLESAVVRPILRPLSVVQQVESVLVDAGWRCVLSDKGVYAREAMELFGGFDGLVAALRDPERRRLMDAYLRKDAPGLSLSHDGRRYLTWTSFEKVAASFDPTEALDRMLRRGILSRGLVLRCQRCRQSAWHSIGTVGEEFRCRRCRLVQPTQRDSWGGSNEPAWSYQLAEVVYQFLSHNGDLPLLAANDSLRTATRPFQHGYELEVTDPRGVSREVDIFALDGYRLWIGEASTTGRFESGRMAFVDELAGAVRAYGVLLATTKKRFSAATEAEVDSTFSGTWPRIIMLTNVKVTP